MDLRIDISGGAAQMRFEPVNDIGNNIYLSLMIPRGSWWFNPEFGSRLQELARAKNTASTAALARDYCREALQWLLDTGRAVAIDIQSERDPQADPHRIQLLVIITQADRQPVTFTHYVGVA